MSTQEPQSFKMDHAENIVQNRKEVLQKIHKHIAAVDEKSIEHYLQTRVCGVKPEFPCTPRYFLPTTERMRQ